MSASGIESGLHALARSLDVPWHGGSPAGWRLSQQHRMATVLIDCATATVQALAEMPYVQGAYAAVAIAASANAQVHAIRVELPPWIAREPLTLLEVTHG